jgi:Cu(I)/Ag(I) efflux system membrane fusion protein
MKRVSSFALAVVLVALTAFAAGAWWTSHRGAGGSSVQQSKTILHYACPMHPQYKSDRPGDCPSCGMRLEPVYADGGERDAPPDAFRLVNVSTERQQLIGVRMGLVEETAGRQAIRTMGRLVPDETRVYPIFAATDGWILEVSDTSTGSMVRKGQRLGSYYSPELVPALQRYFLTIPAGDAGPRTYGNANVQAITQQAIDQLRSLGMTDAQIEEVNRTRAMFKEIWILSPAPGFVLARNISTGQRFEKGAELYRIADLARIWVQADIFGRQADYIKPGTAARVVVPERDRAYTAKVSAAQALFDETTRTLKVRLELDNTDYALKPGMFVDVGFEAAIPPAVTVPSEAVLDSGLRKVVFVDRGNGYFEPRRVETGWRVGDRVQILKGLMVGERIVVEGTFLIDSESRMKAVAAGISVEPATDPVCGMDVDEKKAEAAGRTAAHDGHTYFFCSDECKKKFEADPAKYAEPHDHEPAKTRGAAKTSMPGMPTPKSGAAAGATMVKDPVCGMDVDPKDAAGKIDYQGKTYYFCSLDCRQKFEKSPKQYIK